MTLPESFNWGVYDSAGRVVANFVITAEGEWLDENGSSRGISNELDRELLVHLRNQYRAVLIGGNTARRENYTSTDRFETYVVSAEGSLTPADLNRVQPTDLQNLAENIEHIRKMHGGVLVEAGPSLISKLLQIEALDVIYLTVIGNGADFNLLVLNAFGLKNFKLLSCQTVGETTFLALEPTL